MNTFSNRRDFTIQGGIHQDSVIFTRQSKLWMAMTDLWDLNLMDILLFTKISPGPDLERGIKYIEDDKLSSLEVAKDFLDTAGYKIPDARSIRALEEKITNLKFDLSNFDASFICSGPFRLTLTNRLEKHLILDKDGYVNVYWDFECDIVLNFGDDRLDN